MLDLDKKYYKIKDVAEFLDVTQSTLRYWESEFPEITPRRTASGQRQYTPEDVESLRIIHYLLKTKGLKLDAAKFQMQQNRKNITKRLKVLDELAEVRSELDSMLKTLTKRK